MRLSYIKFHQDVKILAKNIVSSLARKSIMSQTSIIRVYGVSRGGAYVAIALQGLNEAIEDYYTNRAFRFLVVDTLDGAHCIVDDILDSGGTMERYKILSQDTPFFTLYNKKTLASTEYIEFPWEVQENESDKHDSITRLLQSLNQDVGREGLVGTPKRVMKFYEKFLNPEKPSMTVFDSEKYDEMIVQKDIPFFSLCEHHLLPFFGTCSIGYVPKGKILGLSKLARTVKYFAGALQNQERLTNQIAEHLKKVLEIESVAVTITARHLCMEMRGVEVHDVNTVTSSMSGSFKQSEKTRAEFFSLAK